MTQLYKISTDHRERQRAHALLLGQRNNAIPDLADLFDVDRDIVRRWMDRWQEWLLNTNQPIALLDKTRLGRPTILSTDQKKCSRRG